MDTTDTVRTVHFDLHVTLSTPGGVPRVLDKPVVQSSGFVSAIANNDHGVLNWVKFVTTCVAIACVYDTARIRMDIPVVGRDSDHKRHLLKCALHLAYIEVLVVLLNG